ncbi:MAG: hypothetical protein ACK4FF_05605 [Limnobacter sp.]|uniref:hypothetical protein n=1 Tax=Limnobacter sp. TaxID=2003368 RepID=UPI00391A8E62
MNTHTEQTIPAVGTAVLGGFFAGLVNINSQTKGIIVAPKATGEYKGKSAESDERIEGAACPVDGQKNTLDMIAAGSALGNWAKALNIGGFTDWHIPSRDQLEIIYRAFKPTEYANSPYSGVNISSAPPQNLYTNESPKQCELAEFKEGGEEAFDTTWYWTSTQVGAASAWIQYFTSGYQNDAWKGYHLRARAVRTINVSDLTI